MFETIIQFAVRTIDLLYTALVSPFFSMIGHGLEFILIKPMAFLHIPLVLQIVLLAFITAAFSIFIRSKIGAADEEKKFRKRFIDMKKCQEPIGEIADWKQRDVLYRTSDNLIDEEFNTYLAQRFAQQMMIYLIPLFMANFWLEQVFPNAVALQSLRPLLGLNNITISLVFLPSYAAVLVTVSLAKFIVHKKSGTTTVVCEDTQSKHHGDKYGKDTCVGRCT